MITYQQEFLCSCEKEAQELIRLHWEEIATNKETIKLNPDWDLYYALEDRGNLNIYTAREDGRLVGYFVVIVGSNLHYKDHMFAENDILYLHPNYRQGWTGIRLLKFAEKALKEEGVSVIKINTKVHKPFDPLMEWLDYSLTERVYTKYVGD